MSEKELWFYMDKNGVAREYDRSLDLTINFEDREKMEDFIAWIKLKVRRHSKSGGRRMARKRKTTKKMQETKNTIMKLSTSGIEIRTRKSISADEIASRPPYMYTTLCTDPRYRSGSGRLSIVTK